MTHDSDQIETVDETVDETTEQLEQIEPADPSEPSARARRWALPRTWFVGLVIVLLVGGGGTAYALSQRDALPDGAALRLHDTTVTTSQVRGRITALEAMYGVTRPTDPKELAVFRADAAKSMAVQLMLAAAAADRGIVVADKEVSDTLRRLVEQRYPDGGQDAFVAALGDLGASEAQVRAEIGDQLLVSRLFDEVVGDVTVDEADLRQVFDERRADLGTPELRGLSNIVVSDRRAAVAVVRQLSAGAPFGVVAAGSSLDEATRSKEGRLGLLAPEQLEPDYAASAFSKPAGTLFGPVKSESGWNVGRVNRVVAPVPATFDGVRDALRETVVSERSITQWRAWLADLIADNDVEYADGYRPADPGAVPDVDAVTSGTADGDAPSGTP